jgi:hypothetical protein
MPSILHLPVRHSRGTEEGTNVQRDGYIPRESALRWEAVAHADDPDNYIADWHTAL